MPWKKDLALLFRSGGCLHLFSESSRKHADVLRGLHHDRIESQKEIDLNRLPYLIRELHGHELFWCYAWLVGGKLRNRVLLIRLPLPDGIDS